MVQREWPPQSRLECIFACPRCFIVICPRTFGMRAPVLTPANGNPSPLQPVLVLFEQLHPLLALGVDRAGQLPGDYVNRIVTNVDGMVGNPLQVVVDLQNGDNDAQVIGDRLVQGQDL